MTNNNPKITVLGAGAWGCGISTVLANNGHLVKLFTYEEWITKEINEKHISPFLPDITLSKNIIPFTSLEEAVSDADFIFVVIPSKVVFSVLEKCKILISQKAILTICSKGIDDQNHQLLSEICEELFASNQYNILSGPNFAAEVAQKQPTITTIASKTKEAANKVTNLLKNDYFKPVISDDVITVQIIGTIKNIMAIGCGIINGLGLGKNAESALLMKGIDEIKLLSSKLGGKAESLISPAGFGDIFLTCSSIKSRNNSLGNRIGKGEDPSVILSDKNTTYEGANSAESIITFAKKHDIQLPLCQTIYNILYKKIPNQDIKNIIYKTIL